MSARDEVLARVRRALGGRDRARRGGPAAGPYGRRPRACTPTCVDLFAERVEDYRATVVRCTEGEVPGRSRSRCPGRRACSSPTASRRSGSGPASGTTSTGSRTRGLTAAALDRVAAVVSTAAVGIAATGTIVLDHGPGQGRRALTLVPDLHVCVRAGGAGGGRRPLRRQRAGARAAADVGQRTERHQRHRARPGRGRPWSTHAARHPGRARASWRRRRPRPGLVRAPVPRMPWSGSG